LPAAAIRESNVPLAAENRTLRSFAGLAGGEAVARALSFLAMLLVARRLGPAMYGVIGVASGIMLYLNQIVDAGVELSGVPAVARLREGSALSALVSSALGVRTMIAAGLTGLVVLFGLVAFPQPDGAVLALYSLSLVFVAAGTRWVYLGLQHASRVAVARIAGELSTFVFVFVALRDVGDIAMVPIAVTTGWAVTALVMLGGLRRFGLRPSLSFDPNPSRALLDRGPRLVGFTLLGLVLFNADLIYLRFVSGQSAAGFYAAAYTFIAFAANLSVTWAHSVLPSLARFDRADPARNEVYTSALMMAFAVSLPVAVGGMLTAKPLIMLVYGTDFALAASALTWLLPAIPLSALREVTVAALLNADGGERSLIRANAISAVLNIALIVPIVPKFGMVGAAIVTVATEIVRLYLSARYARAESFAVPSFRRLVRPLAAAAVMAAAILILGQRPLPLIVFGAAIAYVATLAGTGAIRFEQPFRPRLVV
jgi:O-antigen/teichoic acid export membrane protein